MATYAIGDIHGCLFELQELLQKIAFNPRHDKIWLVGDLVNRGPQSLETLRFIKSMGEAVVVVLGNHDLHLLALQYHHKFKEDFPFLRPVLEAKDSAELLFWLRQQPLFHHDAQLGYTMVHAGILPSWDLDEAQKHSLEVEQALRGDQYVEFLNHMYGNKPNQWNENLLGYERLRFITNVFARMRFCDANLHLNLTCCARLGEQPPGYTPWFKIPNRKTRNNKIIFGHWAALAGHTYEPLVYALDTGCAWGEFLTAMRLEDEALFQVKFSGKKLSLPKNNQ